MFEIRVAVIGYVSVGKTTVINALFGTEYGEVSMRRTTAVVNSFRISSPNAEDGDEGESQSRSSDEDSEDDSIAVVAKRFTARATLEETKADNAVYRTRDVVKEKTFDICLQKPIHEMRSDTKLVVVDIPGINEAGTSSKYKDYVNDHWHTFDIVVVVMDARQGVNTDEQHNLLELVKRNLSMTKKVPVIILCNKVDDPHNKEQQLLLEEARSEVSKLFGVNDRNDALKRVLRKRSTKDEQVDSTLFPAVISTSAMHAFVYRCGSQLSFDEFCKMDTDFIEKIGKESYGRQWHRFKGKKQLEKAFEAVSDEEQRHDGIQASNFGTFTEVLAYAIGDEKRQTELIRLQAEIAVERLKEAKKDINLGDELLCAFEKLNVLGESTDFLAGAFWAAFSQLKKRALESFPNEFSPEPFSAPMKQLLNYQNALKILPFDGQLEKVVVEAKGLVLLYAVTVSDADKMKTLSHSDVVSLLGSMLLCSSESTFSLHLGQLKLWLESQYIRFAMLAGQKSKKQNLFCDSCSTATYTCSNYNCEACSICGNYFIEDDVPNCPFCAKDGFTYLLSMTRDGSGRTTVTCNRCRSQYRVCPPTTVWDSQMKVQNGLLVPVNKTGAFGTTNTIVVPDSLEDPKHFGHIIWKCCQLLKAAEAS